MNLLLASKWLILFLIPSHLALDMLSNIYLIYEAHLFMSFQRNILEDEDKIRFFQVGKVRCFLALHEPCVPLGSWLVEGSDAWYL